MAMPLEKAKTILKAYKDSNYKASQALPPLGYSGNNVRANSGQIIDTATRAVASSGDKDAILEFLGMTSRDVSREFKKIIEQDKNYPAKLRALEPLLKKQGIQWEEQKINMNPTLNLTVKEVAPSRAVESVAQYILCDVDCTAQHSHNYGTAIQSHPRPDSPNGDQKEEDSRIQNFDEKVTIDKKEEPLPN
jgi:hypothetical protein